MVGLMETNTYTFLLVAKDRAELHRKLQNKYPSQKGVTILPNGEWKIVPIDLSLYNALVENN